jgi:hypothetical protein
MEGSRRFGFVLLVTVAAGLPAFIGEKLLLGDGLPAQAMTFMFMANAMGLVWAGLIVTHRTVAEEGGAARAEATVEAVARERLPALELLDTVPYEAPAVSVLVTGGRGECPWGVQVGDRLEIDSGGRLSSPLCRAAVMALGPVLSQSEEVGVAPVSCFSPLADRHRTFLAQAVGAVSQN